MKNTVKRLFISAMVLLGLGLTAHAQQVNTLYFLENSPHRHNINPAFQPISKVYVSLPVIGYTSFWMGNNSLTMSDVILNQNGKTMWVLNPEVDREKQLFRRIRKSTLLDIDGTIALLGFGFRIKDAGYFHFNINERAEGGASMPKDFFRFLLDGGMRDIDGGDNIFNMKYLGGSASIYTEIAGGYSHKINDHWTVGGKLKVNLGHGYAGLRNKNLALNLTAEEWAIQGMGEMALVLPIAQYPTSINTLTKDASEGGADWTIDWSDPMALVKKVMPAGFGVGVDLGFTYKPIDMVQITASVTDLGFIYWNKGSRYKYAVDTAYTGLGKFNYSDYENPDGSFDGNRLSNTIVSHLKGIYENMLIDGGTAGGFARMTSAKLNIGVDANFWDNRVGVGVYSRTRFFDRRVYEEVTIGAAFRPVHWFNIAASYSFVNGRWSNLGAALGLVTYEGVGLTFAMDYIPMTYAYKGVGNDKNGDGVGDTSIPIPYKTKGINLTFGMNIVIGHQSDKDKDGVKDQYDICPGTPKKVQVDSYGCPIDSDGDGVPDYLDQCPGTPNEAYGMVDEAGCPIDSDGDGVPDYIDKCPMTPEAAWGQVDEWGCPLDSDDDGVPDYLDECPNTPQGARGYVDEHGCLLDTDGDGVPDYIDECPDTPAEARGFVDEKGCELDTDDDGVPDWKDECPDSPQGARGHVDERGCLLDTDGDGVPDYIDECPDTPVEARGFVDEKGCELDGDKDGVPDWRDQCPDTPLEAGPAAVDSVGCLKDTDSDKVPDYLDQCPTIPGVKENHGCPALKKEVRNLLKKAMQGIQFETGKATIKKTSNPLLNQIANVFIDNPTYMVEVQGHTDNVGKPEFNQDLSEKRAQAVRSYLIKAGVPEKQLIAHGYGDTMPIASNKTAKGRTLNRRVEFIVSFEEITYEDVYPTAPDTPATENPTPAAEGTPAQ